MKKIYLYIAIILFTIFKSFAQDVIKQNVYYSAQKLRSYAIIGTDVNGKPSLTFSANNVQTADTIISILKIYFPEINNSNANNSQVVTTIIEANPFLKNVSVVGLERSGTSGISLLNTASVLGSSISGFNVTNAANGVTSFLVKRGKEELLISVIDKLKDSTKFPELPKLFPNTMQLMNSFYSWEYSNVLNTLKAAFDKDLQQLLGNIPNLKTLKVDSTKGSDYSKYSSAAQRRAQLIAKFFATPEAHIYMSSLQIGNGVLNGQKIPDIIELISGTGYLGDIPGASPDVKNAIQLLDILSLSLESNQKGQNYISTTDFTNLLKNPIGSKLYFGLLYQQIKNKQITFTDTNQIASLVQKDSVGIVNYINSLIANTDDLTTAVKNLTDAKKKGEKDLSSYWAAIFESAKQFLQSSTNIGSIDASLKLPVEIQKFTVDGVGALSIANDIANKNYSAAVVDVNNLIPSNSSHKEFKEFFVKYGSFVANLVQAQNADDAENAIEAVALPAGSYTIKQNANWNISVNGYIGYGKDINYAQGIYAPIGFSFSRRYFTLFIPVFDVGSIASYQLANPNTTGTSTNNGTTATASVSSFANNQQIKLGSIFAPGAEAFFGIPKTPFAIGGGWRRTPTLFYSSGQDYLTVGSRWVGNVTLLIDIPIFTVFNRTRD